MAECTNAGAKEKAGFDEVRGAFAQPDMRYAPYQFWFWDQRLDTLGDKPADMARELFEKGFNPGYAHARTNYAQEFLGGGEGVTPITGEEWLSDAWFDAIGDVLKQARADGSRFCVADEFGWPSLQAGGRVLEKYPEMRARSLRYAIRDVRGGAQIELPAATFTVCARLLRTENTSYAAFAGGEWKRVHASFDQSRPCETETLPYNFAARYSADADARAEFHPYFAHAGRWRLFARWCDCGGNSDRARYEIRGCGGPTTFEADQRTAPLAWNLLGEFDAAAGERTMIALSNAGAGVLCVDAIRLENTEDPDDYIVIDDLHTLNRRIGVIDARTLTVLPEAERPFAWRAPEDGEWRVYSFEAAFQRGYDGSTVDNLDARLGERFVEIAYRPYVERFSAFMGPDGPMNGVFADTEGGYGFKLAWSEDLEHRFRENTGEELRRVLPLMVDMDDGGMETKVRCAWYEAVSDLFTENFRAPIRCAQAHGMYYTMHTWEESLPFQANLVGDYFKLNRAVTLPGTDCLVNTAYNPANFLDAASVAEFDGKRCMAEMMALAGLEEYNMAELKRQVNALAAWGVSHAVTHSLKMTRAGAQETDTPDFYNVDPGWRDMRCWTDYVRRISYLNAVGDSAAEVLLVNPMDSIWALTDGANMDPDCDMIDVGGGIPANTASHGGRASEINRVYHEAIRRLTCARVEILSADKHYLRAMAVEDGCLVHGRLRFRTVVLPPMTVMDAPAARRLLEFARAGGNVVCLGELPSGSSQRGRADAEMAAMMAELTALTGVIRVRDLTAALAAGVDALRPPRVVCQRGIRPARPQPNGRRKAAGLAGQQRRRGSRLHRPHRGRRGRRAPMGSRGRQHPAHSGADGGGRNGDFAEAASRRGLLCVGGSRGAGRDRRRHGRGDAGGAGGRLDGGNRARPGGAGAGAAVRGGLRRPAAAGGAEGAAARSEVRRDRAHPHFLRRRGRDRRRARTGLVGRGRGRCAPRRRQLLAERRADGAGAEPDAGDPAAGRPPVRPRRAAQRVGPAAVRLPAGMWRRRLVEEPGHL